MPTDLSTYDDLDRIETMDCPQCGGRTVWSLSDGPREQHRCSTCRLRAQGYSDRQIETFRKYAYYTALSLDERVARANEAKR